MKYKLDLHIHSVLSPCADLLMTADNIIERLLENNIKIFSITDHNSARNSKVIMEKAKQANLFFVPGIEIQTIEEVHVLAYFRKVEELLEFSAELETMLPNFKNREDIYGYQLILDENDEYVEKEERFLAGSVGLGIDEVYKLVRKYRGLIIPAHLDRTSSIISSLGYIPDLDFDAYEIYNIKKIEHIKQEFKLSKAIISNSDAHTLDMLGKKEVYIDIETLDTDEIFLAIRSKKLEIKY